MRLILMNKQEIKSCSISHLVFQGRIKQKCSCSLLHAPSVVFLLLQDFSASLIFSLAHRR